VATRSESTIERTRLQLRDSGELVLGSARGQLLGQVREVLRIQVEPVMRRGDPLTGSRDKCGAHPLDGCGPQIPRVCSDHQRPTRLAAERVQSMSIDGGVGLVRLDRLGRQNAVPRQTSFAEHVD
jgi:hypothetical protein